MGLCCGPESTSRELDRVFHNAAKFKTNRHDSLMGIYPIKAHEMRQQVIKISYDHASNTS
jgi:hypothetical protein